MLQACKRESMSKSARQKLKERNRFYKRKERSRRNDTISNILSPSVSEAFPSRQSYGKARKRAILALPKSPTKRRALVSQIVKDECIIINSSPISSCSSLTVSESNSLSKQVKAFYMDDQISSQAPGLMDFVICREDGKKSRIQKRYLYLTLKETYGIFCQEYPDIKIGLSKFCSLRPQCTLLRRDIPHSVCLCQKHENIRLLLVALKEKGINVESKIKDFIKTVVCDEERELCMNGECDKCPLLNGICMNEDTLEDPCNWKEWKNIPHCQLISNEGTTLDCLNDLNKKLPSFLQHVFIKRKQSEEFKIKKDTLSSEQVVLQIDFAENFSCKEQNEVQTAHWNHGQVTVFTAVAWFLEDSEKNMKSYAVISDNLEHDKYAVNTFLGEIIKDLKSITQFSMLHIFSDGAASQFKQRYSLCNVTYFCKAYEIQEICWSFFATSHGKGAVDGIGGQIKRLAWLEVLSGKSINNALDFHRALSNKDIKTKVIIIKEEMITSSKEELDKRFFNAAAIPNIQKMHHFITTKENAIFYSPYSKSKDIKMHIFKKDADFKTSEVLIEKENNYAVYYDLQYYIGRVINADNEKVTVKFLKKSLGDTYEWPRSDDVEEIERHFIFYGPVILCGSGPFKVSDEKTIIKMYNKMKKAVN